MTLDSSRLTFALAAYALGAWGLWRGLPALRRRAREAALLAASLSLAFGTAEIALRVARPYESLPRFRWLASQRLHHENPPRRRMFSGYVGAVPVVVETNEDGLRTPHSRASFARAAPRVAILGDSFVFGAGVDGPQAFPARLEALLRESAGREAAVLNAGVISYSPLLESIQLQTVVREYDPTLVLLFLDATDIGDDFVYAHKGVQRGERWEFPLEGETDLAYYGALHQLARPAVDWTVWRLRYPLDLLATAVGRPEPPARGDYYTSTVIFEGRSENRFFIYRYPLERTRPYFEETFRHVTAAAEGARRLGARFALVIVPRYHHWSRRECPQDWQRGAYAVDEPFQFEYFRYFDERRASAPFPIIDLLPAFRATQAFPLVFPNDPHWNPDGHAFVARTLAQELVKAGLLAPR
jgi:hypothetical protein